MANNIGVNVVEVDGTGSPSITGAAVSVGAFNIVTQRGVPNEPVRITGFTQFVERFGRHVTSGYGAYLVKGFFDNGGRTAYVNRIVDPAPGTGAVAATRTLNGAGNVPSLVVEAGYRGKADPGGWGGGLAVRVRHSAGAVTRLAETAKASVTGSVIAAAVDMSAFPKLAVRVDSAGTPTELTFAASDFANPAAATRVEIRNAINRQTHLLTAAVGGTGTNQLVLTSTGEQAALTGEWSALQVTAANAVLGFTAMAQPVQGTPAALTAGGTTLARGRDLTAGTTVVVGDTAGTAPVQVKLLTVNASTGAVTWAPALPNPGAFTDLRKVTVSAAEFDLLIAVGGADAGHVVETHTGLTMESDRPNYAVRVLNHELTGSRLVRLADSGGPGTNADRPADTGGAFLLLEGGNDGLPTANHFIGDQATRTGFHAFDPYDVQLVCAERTDTAVASAGIAYCEGRGDALYVGAVPEGFVGGGQAVAYGQALMTKKSYGALYGPWIVVQDPIGVGDNPRKSIPPTGHVMGVFARIESGRGVWKAPAGQEANLLGVLDVETRLSEADHTDLVVNGAVNGIRPLPREGIVIDASRTLSSDPRWRYVNVRLLFNFVKSSLRDGLRWVRQEPNRDTLWDAVKFGTVTPFLTGLWRLGAFGTGSPAETFTVIVDATNNPPDQVQQGLLNIEVYLYPNSPAETVVITVGQQPSGASVSEA
ncbi:phage tail sheath C-terminal domain-containing protein [Streptomyces sp. NPDC047042]|uniref:phage tail sheath C-terminal domain-containing protein n=1 Tax=Streptomyces sp. NPDC047042 TaxID=3154807 RepID=UPI0033CFB9DB